MRGNLAPDGAVAKITGKEGLKFTGPAKCYDSEELMLAGLEQNQTAMQAIGYRQVVEHLRGERSLAETIALVKLRTRQFAKRQRTWFRSLPECRPVNEALTFAWGVSTIGEGEDISPRGASPLPARVI